MMKGSAVDAQQGWSKWAHWCTITAIEIQIVRNEGEFVCLQFKTMKEEEQAPRCSDLDAGVMRLWW